MNLRFAIRRLIPTCLLILSSMVALGVSAAGANQAVPSYQNPVFSRDFPDPMVVRLNVHNYYAYGTGTVWERGIFPILHSSDLVHWTYVGDIFGPGKAPVWSGRDHWAPDVVKSGRTYFAYYTGNIGSLHCIGVATGSRPTGPFKQRAVVGCGDRSGDGYIDPDLLIDRGGKAYLYVSVDSPHHSISVIPMKKNLLHAARPRKELFTLSQAWEHGSNFSTVEGPFTIRRGDRYFLFYSGNDWNGNYAMGVASASSPTGPFTKCTCNPILTGDAKVHGPGGGSVVTGPDGQLWMVYHAWPGAEGYAQGGIRNMRIDPIQWTDGNPKITVTP